MGQVLAIPPLDRRIGADLVVGAVLIPGAAAPKLLTRDMLATLQPGAVLVDVAIDQGGCFESSHTTIHADPHLRAGLNIWKGKVTCEPVAQVQTTNMLRLK